MNICKSFKLFVSTLSLSLSNLVPRAENHFDLFWSTTGVEVMK